MENQKQPKSEQELKYQAVIDMIDSKGFELLRAHMRAEQDKYRNNIVQFLRSKEEGDTVAIKCRMAQQGIDVIENILFGQHLRDLLDNLNPNPKKDQDLADQGGQLY